MCVCMTILTRKFWYLFYYLSLKTRAPNLIIFQGGTHSEAKAIVLCKLNQYFFSDNKEDTNTLLNPTEKQISLPTSR